jgi:hypothetical protein
MKKEYSKYTIADIKEYAISNEYTCLSHTLPITRWYRDLKWGCCNGHTWEKTWNDVYRHGLICHTCNRLCRSCKTMRPPNEYIQHQWDKVLKTCKKCRDKVNKSKTEKKRERDNYRIQNLSSDTPNRFPDMDPDVVVSIFGMVKVSSKENIFLKMRQVCKNFEEYVFLHGVDHIDMNLTPERARDLHQEIIWYISGIKKHLPIRLIETKYSVPGSIGNIIRSEKGVLTHADGVREMIRLHGSYQKMLRFYKYVKDNRHNKLPEINSQIRYPSMSDLIGWYFNGRLIRHYLNNPDFILDPFPVLL